MKLRSRAAAIALATISLEVATADEVVLVTRTRTEFQGLGVDVGSPVWVRPVAGAPTVAATGPSPPPLGDDLVPA